ncbi:MAG: hypothetical protein ACRDRT_09065 [Pseudonocardiaceae bacterium]
MELILGFLVGVISGIVANYFSPAFSRFLARTLGSIAFRFNPDRFDLTGVWIATSEEPASTDSLVRCAVTERVEVTHLGALIQGRSMVTADGRKFNYELRVSQNMLYGAYKKEVNASGVQLGGGMIQMIIGLDRSKMMGSVTWYDSDTQKIEHASVSWARV